MRKYLYAGVVASGFLLIGAAPAYADVQPAPADAQQDAGGLLGSAGGIGLDNPLDGTPLLDVKPGANSILPQDDDVPPARTGFGQAGEAPIEAAQQPVAPQDIPYPGGSIPTPGGLSDLPVGGGLFGGTIPVVGGLLPNGPSLARNSARTLPAISGMPAGGTSVPADATSTPADGTSAPAAGTSVPAGGTSVPAGGTSVPAGGTSVPAGGTSVPAGDQGKTGANKPAADKPTQAAPAQSKPAKVDPAIASDRRLHEEPTDPMTP
jgi:hypothetical protein